MSPAILVYDGDCAFCSSSVEWLRDRLPRFPRAVPHQWLDIAELGLTADDVDHAAWLVDTRDQRRMWRGAEVLGALLAGQQSLALRFAGRLTTLPGASHLLACGYAWVSANRDRMPGGTPTCALPAAER